MGGKSSGAVRVISLCLACASLLALCSPAQAALTRSGTLHAVVTDNFLTGQSTTRYTLRSGKQVTVVRPTELAAEPGDPVVVTGRMRDGRLVGAVEATTASTPATIPAGPRKVAVLLITFPGESSAPWSPEESRAEVFTGARSANAFYQEESYGAISLTGKLRADGDVFGWFRLDSPTAGCPYGTWKDDADAAAAAAGVDLSGYQHLVYGLPYQSSCPWLGTAALGGDWAMVNGNILGVRGQVTIHELGHNLGLLHAGSWRCTAGGVRVQISDTCTVSEYGDPFDAMGNQGTRHNSGWNLAKLGILAPENIETVDATGTYSMRSALKPTGEPTVLRIPRTRTASGNVVSWYYLEVRERGGVFEDVSDATTTGVSVRATAAGSSAETLLLDANPATSTFQDAPLGIGQTFDGGPVRITTLAAGGGSATVSVDLDEEPPTAPTGLTATTLGYREVQLDWVSSTDNIGVDRYVIFRDGVEIGSSSSNSFLDSAVPVGDHQYVVYAEDETRNRSAASEPAAATVVPDEQPPTVPTNLTAAVVPEGVHLEWGPSTDNFGVRNYVVFRDGARIGFGDSSFVDSVSSAGDHDYVVSAVDVAGNRSADSEPAAATVPEITGPICAAGICRVRYRSSGSSAAWTVPPGVGSAEFTVEGGRGGSDRPESIFGSGARVEATLGSLTAGEQVTVSVGGEGDPHFKGGGGGFNGGGDGALGGGGGGFSSVELDSTLMLLAGGGGGDALDGFDATTGKEPGGGNGGRGGRTGTPGAGGVATEAHGATLGRGSGGASGGSGGAGGAAGEVTGTSTCLGGAFPGAAGSAGGSFVAGGGAPGAGGGGGGGYVGGGQGGGAAADDCGNSAGPGGGGGGSSFAAPGLTATFTGGVRRGSGQVSIAYSNPVAAAAHGFTTQANRELVVPAGSGLLSGASGPDGVALSASVVSPPAHGSLTLDADGSFTYVPDSGYSGGDSFTYRVSDASGNYASAEVALTVAGPPSVSISAPPGGGTYVVGQIVPTTFSCSEGAGGAGLSSCDDSTGAKTESGGDGALDTATVGVHAYTVTAVSKAGLTSSAAIVYTVVPAGPGKPPSPESPKPEAPPQVDVFLSVQGKSLLKFVRTQKLVVAARVNKAAKLALSGKARLRVRARGKMRTKSVTVFKRKTVGFGKPGKKKVTLVPSRRGREALRRLPKLTLVIVGKATDRAGEEARRTLALTFGRTLSSRGRTGSKSR